MKEVLVITKGEVNPSQFTNDENRALINCLLNACISLAEVSKERKSAVEKITGEKA